MFLLTGAVRGAELVEASESHCGVASISKVVDFERLGASSDATMVEFEPRRWRKEDTEEGLAR